MRGFGRARAIPGVARVVRGICHVVYPVFFDYKNALIADVVELFPVLRDLSDQNGFADKFRQVFAEPHRIILAERHAVCHAVFAEIKVRGAVVVHEYVAVYGGMPEVEPRRVQLPERAAGSVAHREGRQQQAAFGIHRAVGQIKLSLVVFHFRRPEMAGAVVAFRRPEQAAHEFPCHHVVRRVIVEALVERGGARHVIHPAVLVHERVGHGDIISLRSFQRIRVAFLMRGARRQYQRGARRKQDCNAFHEGQLSESRPPLQAHSKYPIQKIDTRRHIAFNLRQQQGAYGGKKIFGGGGFGSFSFFGGGRLVRGFFQSGRQRRRGADFAKRQTCAPAHVLGYDGRRYRRGNLGRMEKPFLRLHFADRRQQRRLAPAHGRAERRSMGGRFEG